MSENELTCSDVLADEHKNLCNLYPSSENDDIDDVDVDDHVILKDSLYYTESEFTKFCELKNFKNGENLTIISLNIANILSKLRSFKTFINNITTTENQPDIIIVVETHITNSTNAGYTDTELQNILPGYRLFHNGRTTSKGGGVGIFVTQTLANKAAICTEISSQVSYSEGHFENLVVRIREIVPTNNTVTKKDLVIAAVYRQPNSNNFEAFSQELAKLLKALDKRKNEPIIAGDFNLDLLNYERHLPTANYLDLITEHRFLPKIVRPTRIKKQSATLIDHILLKDNSLDLGCGIIDTEIAGNHGYTDHFPTFIVLKTKTEKKNKKETFTKSFFTQAGHIRRKEGLLAEDWTEVYSTDDPNKIFDLIESKYAKHYHQNKTIKHFKSGSNRIKREPWMNNDILADMRKRDRLSKMKDRRDEYKKLRNTIVAKTRKAEREYLQKQIRDSTGNIKKHWKVIKRITNKANNKEEITTGFYHLGNLVTDNQETAEILNQHFANIGKETNEGVGKSKHEASHYIRNHT